MDDIQLISKYGICYGIYFLILFVGKTEHSNRLFDARGPVYNSGILLGIQLAGILWLGVVPFLILKHSISNIVFGQETPTILQVCCLLLLLFASVITAITETTKINTGKTVQQQQVFLFDKKFIRRYILYRTIFLISYEVFFRGYLLTDMIHRAGLFTAIVINTALYALLHSFSDKKEIIACIPFGILLCFTCLWFGAAWPAIVIHTVFAIIYELKLLKKNSCTINKMRYENICHRLFRLYRE